MLRAGIEDKRGSNRRAWLRAAVAVLSLTLGIGAVILGSSGGERLDPSSEGYRPSREDRAVAIGLLLDTPLSLEVTDEALVLAERLRNRYGLDSGDAFADREEAARRAQREFLDRLVFDSDQIEHKAQELGYSLDPDKCADYCDNVRELAIIELKRDALEAFAEGRTWPGRLGEEGELDALEDERRAAEAALVTEER